MPTPVVAHYSTKNQLVAAIAEHLSNADKNLKELTTRDLSTIDEFHIRGRQATLELAAAMKLKSSHHVLDVGSGLGGPARTLAETQGCAVTGIDLTPAFVEVAEVLSDWVGLAPKLRFYNGDATAMPFADQSFDAAISLHAAMNIPDKHQLYLEVGRVLKKGKIFGIYDVLQGEGGDAIYPVPWARDSSISHLVTIGQLTRILEQAGFTIQAVIDSTDESAIWFSNFAEKIQKHGMSPLSSQIFLGEEFAQMCINLARNLKERRVRTVTCIARVPAC